MKYKTLRNGVCEIYVYLQCFELSDEKNRKGYSAKDKASAAVLAIYDIQYSSTVKYKF